MNYEMNTLVEYSDEAILSELRRVVRTLNGRQLTRKLFDSLSRVHSSTITRRFGSWTVALDKAEIGEEIAPRNRRLSRKDIVQALREFAIQNPGQPATMKVIAERLSADKATISKKFGKWQTLLSEAEVPTSPAGRRYSEEECFENILTLWTHYGRQPHFGELRQPPSRVGPKAYMARWGGWRAALSAFVKRVNNDPSPGVGSGPANGASSEGSNYASTSNRTPRAIPLGLRYKVMLRDRFRCVLCGAAPAKDLTVELHVDHIDPWSLGGATVEENLRTLCSNCNLGKGAKVENVPVQLAHRLPRPEQDDGCSDILTKGRRSVSYLNSEKVT